MQKLIAGVHAFQSRVYPQKIKLFRALAEGQSPRALFVTCSDSRVDPNLLTQAEPGELFVLRNPGNFVPPPGSRCEGVEAAIQFAVSILKVRHVIVCGHSDCSAMIGLLHPEQIAECTGMSTWLRHARSVRQIVQREQRRRTDEHKILNTAIEQNVVLQMDNLRAHPCVAFGLDSGELDLHGWVYHIDSGQVLTYVPQEGCFKPLT